MSSTHNPGRVAGFLYLLLVVLAPFRLIYVPSKLFKLGDATATANNIAGHESLFRMGIVTDLMCGVILIFLVLALYRLLKGVESLFDPASFSFSGNCGFHPDLLADDFSMPRKGRLVAFWRRQGWGACLKGDHYPIQPQPAVS